MGLFLAAMVFFVSRARNYPIVHQRRDLREFASLLRDTIFALLSPVIIVLGVVFGVVTLVEVAALAIFYILIISLFVYKSLTLKEAFTAAARAAVFSTSIMIIFAVVGIFQYIVASEQLGDKLQAFIKTMHFDKVSFLLAVNVFYIFMGCIIDAIPVMLIFFPVLLPTAIGLGIDPTHFGVITVLNLMIGLLTPPVGALLFLETKIAGISFGALVKAVTPYTLALFGVLFLITYVPELVTFIPNLVFK
jgi:tripartite ATP-independent transporter DctM subunit